MPHRGGHPSSDWNAFGSACWRDASIDLNPALRRFLSFQTGEIAIPLGEDLSPRHARSWVAPRSTICRELRRKFLNTPSTGVAYPGHNGTVHAERRARRPKLPGLAGNRPPA